MGSVYLAEDPVIGRKVAIKVLRSHTGLAADELSEMMTRFEREFRSAGTLTHPSIVTVYDVGQEDDLPFIAMEYVRGESLEAVLKSQRTLTFKEVSDLAAQLGSALDFAHEREIVHRDIKPANILVNWDGQVKVTDFGVAKLTNTTMTRTGTIIGTPAYMAPEQVTGHQVDGKADQFSVGVILYQLLTGERPFSGESPTSILYKIVHETPVAPQDLNRSLPGPINEVLLKALAKAPADRYESCSDLARAVRRALGASPPDVNPEAAEPSPPPEPSLRQGASQALDERRVQHAGTSRKWSWLLLLALVAAGLWFGWSRLDPAELGWGGGEQEPAQALPDAPPDEAAAAPGVRISTPEGGEEIWLDGAPTGLVTPARLALPGTAGEERRVELRRGDTIAASQIFVLGPELPSRWSPEIGPATTGQALKLLSQPPGARVSIDGAALEETTPTEITLSPGESYEVRIELDGYEPEGATLSLEGLSEQALSSGELFFRLRPSVPPGVLEVVASYPVRLSVGGRNHGPSERLEVRLPPGAHQVRLSADEYFFQSTRNVEVTSQEKVRLPVPELVPITVTAIPGNCRVSIDGREVDVTPLRDFLISAGPHNFEFYWPGLDRTLERTEVISAENSRLSVRPSE